MGRYIAKRLGLAVITLVLLSMIIFAAAQLLPGISVAPCSAATLRPRQSPSTTTSTGPIARRWCSTSTGRAASCAATSATRSSRPSSPSGTSSSRRSCNSLKLAVFAFVLVVPFGILGGVLSGLRVGKATDRGITVVGLSLAVVPEFVTGLVLILVFSIWAGWLPVTAQWEPGSGPLTQVKHLTLPAIALTLVLFGYVARITRAGVVEALEPITRGLRSSRDSPQDGHPAARTP